MISTTAARLADALGLPLVGPDRVITAVAPLDSAGPEALAYAEGVVSGEAGCVIAKEPVEGRAVIIAPDPKLAFIQALNLLFPEERAAGVHPSAVVEGQLGQGVTVGANAVIGAGAVLGDRVWIGEGVVIGPGCRVGDDTRLFPKVVLYPGVRRRKTLPGSRRGGARRGWLLVPPHGPRPGEGAPGGRPRDRGRGRDRREHLHRPGVFDRDPHRPGGQAR
ncbi:MAG: hypothetical protein IPI35_21525 [Deltaproteobacteria bacterium]|nr:hypothetical protein [Deltaproteobacteria bacterium]